MQNKKYILQVKDDHLLNVMENKGISFNSIPPTTKTESIHRLCKKTGHSLMCDLYCFKQLLNFDDIDYDIIINDNSEVIEFFNRLLISGRSMIDTPGHETSIRWNLFDRTKFKCFSDIRDKILTLKIEAWTDGVCGQFIAENYPNVTFKFKEHQVFLWYNKEGHFKHGESTHLEDKDKLFFYTINLRKERLARYKLLAALESTDLEDECLSLSGSHHSLHSIKDSIRNELITEDSYHPDELKDVEWFDGIPKKSFYRRTYCELACETLGNKDGDDTFWPTEKTMKPILMKHPFLILASMHHLKNLRGLGFKTFGDVIDESYDEMPKIDDRIKKIIDNLNAIKKDPVNFWNATIDIREHNYSVLRDLLEKHKNSLVPFEDLI